VTNAENMRHAAQMGLMARGSEHPRAKLAPDDVRAIRSLQGKHSLYHIAKCYGVSRECIKQIFQGKIWKHVA
jgi:hypothetical protein